MSKRARDIFLQDTTELRVVADSSGLVLGINAPLAELLGLPPSEAEGRFVWDFVDTGSLDDTLSALARLVRGGQVSEQRLCVLTTQRKQVWTEWEATPAEGDGGMFGRGRILSEDEVEADDAL